MSADPAPYDLYFFHETLREMASAYLRLEVLHAAAGYADAHSANHVEFWNIIQRLAPHEAGDESRLPHESLYVGDAPVSFGDLRSTSAHRLILGLCVDTLMDILRIAHELVPTPSRKPWPPRRQPISMHLALVPPEWLEPLVSLILFDHDGEVTAGILRQLTLRSLKTDEETILLVLQVECLRAVHRRTVIDGAARQSAANQQAPTTSRADGGSPRRRKTPRRSPSRREPQTLSELEAAALRLREELPSDGEQRTFGQVADELNKQGFVKRNGSPHDYNSAKAAYRNASGKG